MDSNRISLRNRGAPEFDEHALDQISNNVRYRSRRGSREVIPSVNPPSSTDDSITVGNPVSNVLPSPSVRDSNLFTQDTRTSNAQMTGNEEEEEGIVDTNTSFDVPRFVFTMSSSSQPAPPSFPLLESSLYNEGDREIPGDINLLMEPWMDWEEAVEGFKASLDEFRESVASRQGISLAGIMSPTPPANYEDVIPLGTTFLIPLNPSQVAGTLYPAIMQVGRWVHFMAGVRRDLGVLVGCGGPELGSQGVILLPGECLVECPHFIDTPRCFQISSSSSPRPKLAFSKVPVGSIGTLVGRHRVGLDEAEQMRLDEVLKRREEDTIGKLLI